jgi:hypothetical protein
MQARTLRSRARSYLATVALLIAAAVPILARAQQNPERVVDDLNREAMEAYNALDINKAGSMLEEALRVGYQGGVSPPLLARTHVNLAVVLVGGVGDQDAGLNSFVQALCIDPSVQLDPLTSTPDIQNVYNVAIQRARGGACSTGGGAAPGIAPQQAAVAPPPPDQALVHHSPPEQLTQTPLPLYVEIHPLARATEVILVYKGTGMKQWKRVPMHRYQNGMAYQVSCGDVWEPKVGYYIEARDENDRVVGTAGTAAQPIEVPVVAKRTQPQPALPGAVPPESCAAKECPPGLAGCVQPGTAAIGDACEKDTACQSGLECREDECALIGGGGTEVPEIDPATGGYEEIEEPEVDDPNEFKPTYIQLGFTVGLAYVQAGMIADRPPPDNRVFIDEFGNYIADPYVAAAAMQSLFFAEPGTANEPRLTAWVPDADSADSIDVLGGNCTPDGTATGPLEFDPTTNTGLLPSRYCVRVKSPGFVPNPALRLAIGHFFTPKISVAAILRFQFSAGEGTLPNMLVGARGEYMLTEQKSKGFMISAFAGGTFGEIQAQPPADGSTEGAPFVRSGLFGLHAGAAFRYRFSPNFGLFMAPELDVQLPTVLFNVDLTLAGAEAAF